MNTRSLRLAAFILSAAALCAQAKVSQGQVAPDGPSEGGAVSSDAPLPGMEAPKPRRKPRHAKSVSEAPAVDPARVMTMPSDGPVLAVAPAAEAPKPRRRRRPAAETAPEQLPLPPEEAAPKRGAPAEAEARPPRRTAMEIAAEVAAAGAEAAREAPPAESVQTRMVKSYIEGRIAQLKRSAAEQEEFGTRMYDDWRDFWAKLNRERRQFELSTARQRINFFDSLATLDPSAHAQSLSKFESYQSQQIWAFEKTQKEALEEFFKRLHADLREFSQAQERQRETSQKEMESSWKDLKKGEVSMPPAPRKVEERAAPKLEPKAEPKAEPEPAGLPKEEPQPEKKKKGFFD